MLEDGRKMVHVFRKKLGNGDCAYALFNLGETRETVKVYPDRQAVIRDVWAKQDLGESDVICEDMMPHTVRIFRCRAVD